MNDEVTITEVRLTVHGLSDDFNHMSHQSKREYLIDLVNTDPESWVQQQVVDWLRDPRSDVYFFKPTTAPIGQVEIRPYHGP